MNQQEGELVREKTYLTQQAKTEILQVLSFLENFEEEMDGLLEISAPNPYVKMSTYLVKRHLEAKAVTGQLICVDGGQHLGWRNSGGDPEE